MLQCGGESIRGETRYDEYGTPASGNSGFFQYAGQPWLAPFGGEVYYSRARMYDPRLGRFLQPDPIGYGGGMNMYAYVGGDPVNRTDPSGLIPETPCLSSTTSCEPDIRVTGTRTPRGPSARLRDFSLGTSFPQDAGCAYSFADLQDYCFAEARRRQSDNPYASSMQFASLQGTNPARPRCIASTDGPVLVSGITVTIALIAGGTFTAGSFETPSTGATGRFTAGGANLGVDGFLGAFTGRYNTFRDFSGGGGGLSISGRLGAGGWFNVGGNGEVTGQGSSAGAGGGASLSYGGVRIKASNYPIC